jgi:hypothetical protein
MATAPQRNLRNTNPLPPLQPHLIEPKPLIVPGKFGFMGEQGTGKSTTAALLAAALSALHHDRAPVHVTDAELGWQFLDPLIFQKERIPLVIRTVPTFAGMLKDIEFAEREGACVWAVELGKIWIEIVRTLQKTDPVGWGMQLRSMWDDFVARFLNSKMHCLVLGRIQDVIEDVVTESGKIQSIKVGEGMKAGGQRNNFGYEPHCVIRMYLEQKPRTKKGKMFEDEGRMVHRAHVLKDRTWAINGAVYRWQDRDGYQPGDFKYVWNALKPHFEALQRSNRRITLDTLASSAEIIQTDGNGEFYRERDRRERLFAEIKACLDMYFAGQGKEDKQMRLAVTDLIFGVKSSEAAAALTAEKLERGLRILHGYEKLAKHNLDSKESVLTQMVEIIQEYDRGESEIELPF